MGRIRKRSRKEMADPFGLTTLDTVTCALGGAIIIMLLLAALVHPSAQLSVNRGQLGLAGTGDDSQPIAVPVAEGEEDAEHGKQTSEDVTIAVLILSFDEPVEFLPITASCAGAPVNITQTRDAESNFDPSAASVHALTLRFPSPGQAVPCVRLSVPLTLPAGLACEITLVAGRHIQRQRHPRGCPSQIEMRSNEGQVFFLRDQP